MIKVNKYTEVHFFKCIFPYKLFWFFSFSLQSPKLLTIAFNLPAHSSVYIAVRSHVHRGPQGQKCNTPLDSLNSCAFSWLEYLGFCEKFTQYFQTKGTGFKVCSALPHYASFDIQIHRQTLCRNNIKKPGVGANRGLMLKFFLYFI